MKNLLNAVKIAAPKKSNFDLSHDVKLSCNMGLLIPVMWEELVPGDRVSVGSEAIVRMAPMLAPMMHQVNVCQHTFAVPMRILWDNWENFITNTEVGSALPAFPVISYDSSTYALSRLLDYLGLPPLTGVNAATVSAMPLAAYQCIYNEYYRDQNLIAEVDYKLVDGSNDANPDLYPLRKRAWEHDYFTACLPFAQKGDAVEIPISGVVSVVDPPYPDTPIIRNYAGGAPITNATNFKSDAGPDGSFQVESPAGTTRQAIYDPNGTLEVKNADTTINDLRKAYALQRFLEKLARGGSRYIEYIKSMFNVNSSDKRLQRPEYITGSVTPIMISEVLNTTGTTDAPQGAMAGHGVSNPQTKNGTYFAEEHCIVMTVMSIMPRTAYQDGINRKWLKINTPYDYFVPDFEHIGEQEVTNIEVYADQDIDPQAQTFGYLPRYAEYKVAFNRVAGDFRTTLDFWHMGRKFTSPPALNSTFIECNPTFRVFAVEDENEDHLWCLVHNRFYANRPMSRFSTPTF